MTEVRRGRKYVDAMAAHVWTTSGKDPDARRCVRCQATAAVISASGPEVLGLTTKLGVNGEWVVHPDSGFSDEPPRMLNDEDKVRPPETCEETTALLAALTVHGS